MIIIYICVCVCLYCMFVQLFNLSQNVIWDSFVSVDLLIWVFKNICLCTLNMMHALDISNRIFILIYSVSYVFFCILPVLTANDEAFPFNCFQISWIWPFCHAKDESVSSCWFVLLVVSDWEMHIGAYGYCFRYPFFSS